MPDFFYIIRSVRYLVNKGCEKVGDQHGGGGECQAAPGGKAADAGRGRPADGGVPQHAGPDREGGREPHHLHGVEDRQRLPGVLHLPGGAGPAAAGAAAGGGRAGAGGGRGAVPELSGLPL